MCPSLVGVGLGPGDPELVTLQALRVVREAGKVFAPTIALDAPGRAELILRQAAPDVAIERLVFAISGDEAERSAAHESAAQRISQSFDGCEKIAFVTLGDPNVYSTFHHLARSVVELRMGIRIRTVPGIMAFQDLAARTGALVIDGCERLYVVSAVEGPEAIDVVVDDGEAGIVVYKGGRHLPELAKRLYAAGRAQGAVFGEMLGLPGERIGALDEVGDQPAAYLTSILVPPVSRRGDVGSGTEERR